MATRELIQSVKGMPAMDGAGVRLTRILGTAELDMLDPFLMLDAFASDQADDYIAGFPDHPHRGFETVTYLIAGRLRHKDSTGREGVIEAGGVQWMTAGRGIIHSEMPEQKDGLLMGFQLWVNLPASAKMIPPVYQEYSEEDIPVVELDKGVQVKVICGECDKGTGGVIANDFTDPLFFDIRIPAGAEFTQSLPEKHHAFVYAFEGEVEVEGKSLPGKTLGVLGEGTRVRLSATQTDARCLLVAGKPLNEAVARSGPFVMNTREELMQAYEDYQSGRF